VKGAGQVFKVSQQDQERVLAVLVCRGREKAKTSTRCCRRGPAWGAQAVGGTAGLPRQAPVWAPVKWWE
jgi:hypothetical protein